jgi:hypothetical protein
MPRNVNGRGRKKGLCDVLDKSAITGLDGRAIGLGGYGRGQCQILYGNTPTSNRIDKDLQRRALKNRAEMLQSELDLINSRLKEMEAAETA